MPRTTRALILATLAVSAACRGRDRAGDGPYASEVADAIPRIEAATHLRFKRPPKIESRSKEQVRAYLEKQFDEQAPAQELAGEEKALHLLGLIPDTMQLRPFMLDLLEEEVAGYYDPSTKVLYVVTGGDRTITGMTVQHELVHALQDQYVNVDSIEHAAGDADRKLAASAVLEGQATYVGFSLQSGAAFDPDKLGGWSGIRQLIRQNYAKLPKFSAAPTFVQEELLFPYLSGAEFVRNERLRDSTVSPLSHFPLSTEQVMHTEAFHANPPDLPIAVTLPTPRGGTRVYDDVMGDFGARLFIYEHLRDLGVAASAAKGWGGDRYMVVHTPAGDAIVWLTVWDTPLDAGQFGDALKAVVNKRFGYPRETKVSGGSTFAAGARSIRVTGGELSGHTYVLYVDVPAGGSLDVIDPRAARLAQ